MVDRNSEYKRKHLRRKIEELRLKYESAKQDYEQAMFEEESAKRDRIITLANRDFKDAKEEING